MNGQSPLIPFMVADRPASLRILRGIPFSKYKGPLGLMTHANTSTNFQKQFRDFPCGSFCGGNCDNQCKRISERGVIKICDSGVFSKQGCLLNYPTLFNIYNKMNVQYGIIIDFLSNSQATIKSARKAMRIYNRGKYKRKQIL